MPYRPNTISRSTAMPADCTQCRVRKQSNECESETRLVRARGQALRLPNAGALGALTVRAVPSLRPKDRFVRTRLYLPYFSNRSPPRDHINSCGISAQFSSTYHSVRLHISFAFMGKRTDYYSLEQSLECDPDFFCSHLLEQAPIRSPSGKYCARFFCSHARVRASVPLIRSPSGIPCDQAFCRALTIEQQRG